jgi:hypothetical protein
MVILTMNDREDIQDRSESELDIEEIDNSTTTRRLRSRPSELTQIDREEGNETSPPRPRSERTLPSRGRNHGGIKDNKILQIAALTIVGILMLSNLILIYEISSVSNKQKDMSSNISLLINKSNDIINNFSSLKEKISKSNMDNSSQNNFAANLSTINLSLTKVNISQKNIGNVNNISNMGWLNEINH